MTEYLVKLTRCLVKLTGCLVKLTGCIVKLAVGSDKLIHGLVNQTGCSHDRMAACMSAI